MLEQIHPFCLLELRFSIGRAELVYPSTEINIEKAYRGRSLHCIVLCKNIRASRNDNTNSEINDKPMANPRSSEWLRSQTPPNASTLPTVHDFQVRLDYSIAPTLPRPRP